MFCGHVNGTDLPAIDLHGVFAEVISFVKKCNILKYGRDRELSKEGTTSMIQIICRLSNGTRHYGCYQSVRKDPALKVCVILK